MIKCYFKSFKLIVLCLFIGLNVAASELEISHVRPIFQPSLNKNVPSVILEISWKNAWHNAKNHDAIWLFGKFSGYWNNHVKLAANGHKVLHDFNRGKEIQFETSPDSLGIILSTNAPFRGDVHVRIEIMLDTTNQKIDHNMMNGLQMYGIEMVYIPPGPFTLGSPDTPSINYASFYRSDDMGKPNGLYKVTSEDEISIGPELGLLYYWSNSETYNGDQSGPVPAAFPKGYDPFYIMKYELSQGDYVAFLNHLYIDDTYRRSPIGGKNYHNKRGSILFENGKYVAPDPKRPMNFISWEDGCAFTDWAAMRPISELEYTKAARGPAPPIPFEMVWGTDNYDQLMRTNIEDGNLILQNNLEESDLSDGNRPSFGASYYWVMDLSGSVWEKVITIGNQIGRQFTRNHGDGHLRFGKANVATWPVSNDEIGGYGYRGGGYYESDVIGEFNPHSPIGYRFYGSWSGGPRSIAYGYRAGRSFD